MSDSTSEVRCAAMLMLFDAYSAKCAEVEALAVRFTEMHDRWLAADTRAQSEEAAASALREALQEAVWLVEDDRGYYHAVAVAGRALLATKERG